jgi:hypothetical protein
LPIAIDSCLAATREAYQLAHPFARLLLARELQSLASAEYVMDAISKAIQRSFGTNIEAQLHMGRYVAPGNVQKVILKPKQRRGWT